MLARIPARQTLVTRTPWHRESEVLVLSLSYLDIIGKVYEVVGVFKLQEVSEYEEMRIPKPSQMGEYFLKYDILHISNFSDTFLIKAIIFNRQVDINCIQKRRENRTVETLTDIVSH